MAVLDSMIAYLCNNDRICIDLAWKVEDKFREDVKSS